MNIELIRLNPQIYLAGLAGLAVAVVAFWRLWCRERVVVLGILASTLLAGVVAVAGTIVLYRQGDLFALSLARDLGIIDGRTAMKRFVDSGTFKLEDEASWQLLDKFDPQGLRLMELTDPLPWLDYYLKHLGRAQAIRVEVFFTAAAEHQGKEVVGEKVLGTIAGFDTRRWPDFQAKLLSGPKGEQLGTLLHQLDPTWPTGVVGKRLLRELYAENGRLLFSSIVEANDPARAKRVEDFLAAADGSWRQSEVGARLQVAIERQKKEKEAKAEKEAREAKAEKESKEALASLLSGKSSVTERKKQGEILARKNWRQLLDDPLQRPRLAAMFPGKALPAPGEIPRAPLVHRNQKDGYELVLVPGGEFIMGSAAEDKEAHYNERPRHIHRLSPYLIGRYEVTVGQFKKFVEATGHNAGNDWRKDPGTHPVRFVNWYDATDYAKWAGLRLPTEAEWELAARGYEGRRYPWGEEWEDGRRVGLGKHKGTVPVNAHPEGAGPFGTYQQAGNVWEWCEDVYGQNAYSRYAKGDFSLTTGAGARVVRGASWDGGVDPGRFRGAFRLSFYDPALRFGSFGFRLARTP